MAHAGPAPEEQQAEQASGEAIGVTSPVRAHKRAAGWIRVRVRVRIRGRRALKTENSKLW